MYRIIKDIVKMRRTIKIHPKMENQKIQHGPRSTITNQLAIFDFDHTLVCPKEGRTFPKNIDDWQLLRSNIISILQSWMEKGFHMVIVTDQTKVWKVEMIQQVCIQLFPWSVTILIHRLKENHKPNTDFFLSHFPHYDPHLSFYVGDAAGRVGEWSNVDRLFAEKLGIRFYTPEEMFPIITTPTQLFPQCFEPGPGVIDAKQIEMILMMGLPASGKSTFIREQILASYGDFYEVMSGDEWTTDSKRKKKVKEIVWTLKKSPVIDVTNVSRVKREFFIEMAREWNIPIRCYSIRDTLERILERNRIRNETIEKKVPNVAIHTLKKKWENVELEEGFVEIIRIEKDC